MILFYFCLFFNNYSQLAINANMKNTDQQIMLLGWSADDGKSPEVCLMDLCGAGSEESKENRIRGYMNIEKLRGFSESEVPIRITRLIMSEDRSDMLITWDARYIPDTAVDWLCSASVTPDSEIRSFDNL